MMAQGMSYANVDTKQIVGEVLQTKSHSQKHHSQRALKILLTGAPGSGKSSISKLLRSEGHSRIMTVPETPSIFFENGLSNENWAKITGEESLRQIVDSYIFALRIRLEDVFFSMALLSSKQAVFFDRGVYDFIPYRDSDQQMKFIENGHVHLDKYDVILHFQSFYTSDAKLENIHTKTTDPCINKVSLLENNIRHLWNRHSNYHYIPIENDIRLKYSRTKEVLRLYNISF